MSFDVFEISQILFECLIPCRHDTFTGLSVINHVKGSAPACDCMEFGEVRFGTHKSDKPLVHKITNKSDDEMYCIDAEVLSSPPIVSTIPLDAEHHKLVKTRDKFRVYKLTLRVNCGDV